MARGGVEGLSDHLYLHVDLAVRAQLIPLFLRAKLAEDHFAYALQLVQRAQTLATHAAAEHLCALVLTALGEARALELLKHTLTSEIAASESEGTLLRGNTTATKLLTAYSNLHGKPYLRAIVAPFVRTLAQDARDYTWTANTAWNDTGDVTEGEERGTRLVSFPLDS